MPCMSSQDSFTNASEIVRFKSVKPRYILYFKARDRSAINQAMAAYSVAWARQQKQERSAAEPTLDPTREAPGKKVERIRQKGMER